jgi:hypothetical protein
MPPATFALAAFTLALLGAALALLGWSALSRRFIGVADGGVLARSPAYAAAAAVSLLVAAALLYLLARIPAG